MRIYKIYPDFLDIGWIGCQGYNRKLVARYSSIAEHELNSFSKHYTPSPLWEDWGKELAKL